MHEYCGFCVCFQCHEKRRSHEMTDRRYDLHDLIIERDALQGRVKELEAENEALVEGSCLAEFNGYKRAKEENARLQKLIDMNQRVVDAAREALMNCLVERDEPDGIKFIVEEALRELDGEKEMPVGEAIKRQRKKLGW